MKNKRSLILFKLSIKKFIDNTLGANQIGLVDPHCPPRSSPSGSWTLIRAIKENIRPNRNKQNGNPDDHVVSEDPEFARQTVLMGSPEPIFKASVAIKDTRTHHLLYIINQTTISTFWLIGRKSGFLTIYHSSANSQTTLHSL